MGSCKNAWIVLLNLPVSVSLSTGTAILFIEVHKPLHHNKVTSMEGKEYVHSQLITIISSYVGLETLF